MPEDYYGDRYSELNRQLAKRERSAKRKGRESLAARGALHSGMTNTTERDIEGQIGDMFTAGARDIEDRRWRSEQDEISRKWQTGERIGSQEWGSSESAAERNVRLELQKRSDAERYRLQQLVNSGQMDLQEAEQQWTSYENDLNRELEWRSTSGQWGHEAKMQETGLLGALNLQQDAQGFEEYMAKIGRDWELADRPWQEAMWLMDAQLQMLVAGYDWLKDEYEGGTPSWMVEEPEKPGLPPSGQTGYTEHPLAGGGEGGENLSEWQQSVYAGLTPEQQTFLDGLSPEWWDYYLHFYSRGM